MGWNTQPGIAGPVVVNCILEPGSIGDVGDDDNGFGWYWW